MDPQSSALTPKKRPAWTPPTKEQLLEKKRQRLASQAPSSPPPDQAHLTLSKEEKPENDQSPTTLQPAPPLNTTISAPSMRARDVGEEVCCIIIAMFSQR